MFVARYCQVSDNGTSASIGIQDCKVLQKFSGILAERRMPDDANKFTQYSFNTPDIYPSLELTLNSNTGVITTSTFDRSGSTTFSTG